MRHLSSIGRAALLGASAIATVAAVVGPVYLSWRLALDSGESPDTRLRLYLAATTAVPKGAAIRDEHVAYRFGRIAAPEPIPHRSEAVGRYARADIAEGDVVTRATVSVVTEISASTDNVLVAVAVKPFHATHLAVGMSLAFARAVAESEEDDPEEDQEAAAAAEELERSATQPRQDVLGLGSGFPLVALSTSGEGDSAVAVLEVLLPRDEAVIRELAVGEWHPIVLPKDAE